MSIGDTRVLTRQVSTRYGNLAAGATVTITDFSIVRRRAVALVDTHKGPMTIQLATLRKRSTGQTAQDLMRLAVSRPWNDAV